MKKIFVYFLILILLPNCGFSPIYVKKDLSNYNIEFINVEGDRLINNLISGQLNRNKDETLENKINIDIVTKYKKKISSKDATGAAASYELTVTSEIKVNSNNGNKNFIFNERFIMDKNENLLDEKNYERTIKQSFASLIAGKIILELNSFK